MKKKVLLKRLKWIKDHTDMVELKDIVDCQCKLLRTRHKPKGKVLDINPMEYRAKNDLNFP